MLRDAELWPVSDGGSYFEQYLATMARRTATLLLLAAWLAAASCRPILVECLLWRLHG